MASHGASTAGRPPTAAGTNPASSMPSSSSSPFISLAIQCDALYSIGGQPHSYAFLSEQSVYNRAAEQLRFWTPSPLHTGSHPPAAHEGDALSGSTPRICVVAPAAPPFPSLRVLEQARAAEVAARSPTPQRGHATAAVSSTTASVQPLVSSGVAVAAAALHDSFPSLSALARRGAGEGETTVAGEATTSGSSGTAGMVNVSPLPAAPAPTSAALHFPAPVLLRSIAQMVVTMQTSQQSSAARFSLAQYRGVALPVWRHAVQQSPSLADEAAPLSGQEAVVLSVLPQVVAERWSCAASAGSQKSKTAAAAVFYAIAPASLPDSACTQVHEDGRKRRREENEINSDIYQPVVLAEPRVVPAAVRCARLSRELAASAAGQERCVLHYTTLQCDAFDSPFSSCHDSSSATYDSETAWLTHGLLLPLFTFPGVPLLPSAKPAEPLTEESRRSTHAAFNKTSAFLFLAYLVHHSWCLAIHKALSAVLCARPGVAVLSMQATCLPDLAAARRSPQHEWGSLLTYRLVRETDGEKGEGVGAPLASSEMPPLLGQLTVRVVNRTAELTWWLGGKAEGGSVAVAPSAGEKSMKDRAAVSSVQVVKNTGSLDDLIRQL